MKDSINSVSRALILTNNQGKWFKYKSKDDNGFCRICIKKEKMPGISKDDHGNLLFNSSKSKYFLDIRISLPFL